MVDYWCINLVNLRASSQHSLAELSSFHTHYAPLRRYGPLYLAVRGNNTNEPTTQFGKFLPSFCSRSHTPHEMGRLPDIILPTNLCTQPSQKQARNVNLAEKSNREANSTR
jgi:hypothetical protein